MLTVIEAAHDGVVTVVEEFPEPKCAVPAGIEFVLGSRFPQPAAGAIGDEQSAYLRAQDEFKAGIGLRSLEQGVAQDMLRLSQAVHRRGVEVA